MKRFIALLTALVLALSPLCLCANAIVIENKNVIVISETVTQLDDNSSITVTVTEEIPEISTYATSTKTGSKTYTYKKDGEIQWKLTVTGKFRYEAGVSSEAISASYSVSDLASGWSSSNHGYWVNNNTANAEATFTHKVLFITDETKECRVTLTCDKNGSLS